MDLSHWDLVSEFTMREAACLAGGTEPLVYQDLPPEQRAKADLIYREIWVAYSAAQSAASFALNSKFGFEPGETTDSIFRQTLPSIELKDVVHQALMHGHKITLDDIHGKAMEAPYFSREDLGAWFALKGLRPIYSFARATAEIQPPGWGRQHVSDKLAKLNQAAARFWGNADRDDRGTHPDNATVAAWLVQQGFTPTLADKATTIIRPEWAPTGRKPED